MERFNLPYDQVSSQEDRVIHTKFPRKRYKSINLTKVNQNKKSKFGQNCFKFRFEGFLSFLRQHLKLSKENYSNSVGENVKIMQLNNNTYSNN